MMLGRKTFERIGREDMAIRILAGALGTGLAEQEIAEVKRMLAQAGRVTLLVSSFRVRDICRRELARAGVGLGVDVLTASEWVGSLWGVLGDGRQLVGGLERKLIMAQVLAEGSESGGAGLTPGIVSLHARAAAQCLPFLSEATSCAPDQGAAGASGSPLLSAAERELVETIVRYGEKLDARGLVEPSAAALALAEGIASSAPACAAAVMAHGVDAYPEHVLVPLDACARVGEALFVADERASSMVSQLERRFGVSAENLSCDGESLSQDGTGDKPAVRFAEVAGPSARDAAYTQLLLDVAGSGEVFAASADPLSLSRHLAPRLAVRGVSSRTEARVRFAQTRAGEMFFMLIDLIDRMKREETGAWWPAPEVVDWVRSPFAGVWSGASRVACALDKSFRSSRLIDAESVLKDITSLQSNEVRLESEHSERQATARRPVAVSSVLENLAEGSYRDALAGMLNVAQHAASSMFGRDGYASKLQEIAALKAACSCLEEAARLGTDALAALSVLSDLPVRVTTSTMPEGCGEDAATVTFGTSEAAAELSCGAVAATVLLDMDAESCPCSRRENPATLLAAKLGCSGVAATLAEQQRIAVRRALAGGATGVLAFVSHTRGGEEVFPAFAYDELAVELRASGAYECVANLPTEHALVGNLDTAGGEGLQATETLCAAKYTLPEHLVPYVYLPQRGVGGEARVRRQSASSIEAYLSCPYRWFVSNRARANRIDVTFGAIERGYFIHDVLQRFHERLLEEGLKRVTPQNLEQCLELMRITYEELRQDHAQGKLTHGKYAKRRKPQRIRQPYVPLSELERKKLESLVPLLEGMVRAEADMLPIFTPSLLEYSFDFADVSYAGRPLGGRIDRIDVAPDAGSGERFVVIDYKSSGKIAQMAFSDPTAADLAEGEELSSWIPGRDQDSKPVVQTLIYAQAYRRMANASPQGALYFIARGAEVAAMVDEALVSMEPPALSKGKVCAFPELHAPGKKSKKPEGTLEFEEMLDLVEAGIAKELDKLEAGVIAPAPVKGSCAFCPNIMCERKR